jgi:large subunit ribosomal protein L4
MKLDVTTIEAGKAGTVELSDAIFGLDPRQDLIHRVIQWQLNKRQQGTHQAKSRGEINRTTAKLGKQKGGGTARHAISAKVKSSELLVLDKAEVKNPKTKEMKVLFAKLGWTNALIIDGATVNEGFANAARNIIGIDVLPIQGINVYDILRRKNLVLTKAAVEALEARFK